MIVRVFDFSKDRVIECFLNPLIFEPFFYYRHMLYLSTLAKHFFNHF